ncbi:hypothetical protein FD755_010019 [Muntiacus reevesi]|uniref:Protein kinase domain-containing protein n=1 Tax=Muntiacus reevesi TaxID=9886 RepID=A0A5N3XXH7_MUNRE|nr:hypothetical protein FD755_010019 [Muntiacus reevesi]
MLPTETKGPEVLKSEPYGEKADVWAAGCILYQMATLDPPFYSTNMLSLATKIVEAVYEPVPEGIYSEKVITTISRCLTPDAETRPDIVEVSSMISDIMMKYVDNLSASQLALEKKLERERRRTQRYFMEANRNAITCQQGPTLLSQLDDELDISDNFSSSSSSPLKESTFNFAGGIGSRPRPALLPLDLLLKVPPLLLRAHVKELEAEVVTGWQSHSLPTVILHRLKDHAVCFLWRNLPPALHHNLKRRIIERFKKSLFSQQSNPCNLKSEIKKTVIEEVLEESGYYNFTSNRNFNLLGLCVIFYNNHHWCSKNVLYFINFIQF